MNPLKTHYYTRNFCFTVDMLILSFNSFYFLVAGQEDNVYAKKNYDKYLSALKNSGLVSVEEKTQTVAADVVGAEGGAGAVVLLGKACQKKIKINITVQTFMRWEY